MKVLSAWNLEGFVEATNAKEPYLPWRAVFENLDGPDLEIACSAGLATISSIHRLTLSAPLPMVRLHGI